jgi:hypothetical protein
MGAGFAERRQQITSIRGAGCDEDRAAMVDVSVGHERPTSPTNLPLEVVSLTARYRSYIRLYSCVEIFKA